MSERPTPETDAEIDAVRKLCRELDEVKAERDILRLDAQREAGHHDRMVGELEKVYDERNNLLDLFTNLQRELYEAKASVPELREQVKELIYIAERAIALAEIDFENDKFGVVSELRGDLEKIKEAAK